VTILAYGPAFQAGWVWDDDSYVTANAALRTVDGLRRIWLEPGAVAQYYPVTFTSLWIEYQLHGLAPASYHATNVLLHAANAVLVGLVLQAAAVPAPWAGALLFAVHPLHVESVAWVTERKNVLSAFFYLLSLLALLGCRDASDRRAARSAWYVAALGCFALALLSKTVTSTLPAVYLALRWWRTGRIARDDVIAMLPFVVGGVVAGTVTAGLERWHVGAEGAFWNQTFGERMLIAGRALWFYTGKLLWPRPLVFIYPRWPLDVGSPVQWALPIAAAVGGLGLLAARERIGRGPFAAALAFAVTLGPALGFVNVYPMRYSFVADHFAYLASVPLLALVAGCGMRLVPEPRVRQGILALAAALLALLTWERSLAFRDAATLWRDTLAKNPQATIAHVNLGYDLHQAGRSAEALALFDAGLALEPQAGDLWNNRGLALSALGRTEEALASYRRAAEVDPTNAQAPSNLGNALAAGGRYPEAAEAFREALRRRPGFAEAHNNLANVLAIGGDSTQAIAHYQQAIALDPGYVEAQSNLGEVLLAVGRMAEACERFAEALRLRPRDIAPTIGRVRCLAATGRVDEAIAFGTDALGWATQSAELRRALARVLDQGGRADEAALRLREARAIDPAVAGPQP
jgi:tetratricopeptide (TPR) repeat protein